MKKTLTFGLFYDLFIAKHTNMKIRTSINQIFYGNADGSSTGFVTQAQCSKIRKEGIMPGSQLCKDYLSENLTVADRASYLKGLNLYGFDSGKDVLNQLDDCHIPDTLRNEIFTEPDLHIALAKLLYFLVAIPPQAEELLFSKKEENEPGVAAQSTGATTAPALNGTPGGTLLAETDHLRFFDEIFRLDPKELCVDMAFHSGHDFFFGDKDVALLQKMLTKGFRIRVLINTREQLSPLFEGTRQPGKIYQSFEEISSLWRQKMIETDGQIVVRITNAPLMHKTYICHNSAGFEMGLVRFYLYGNYSPINEVGHVYHKDSAELRKFRDEFEYLWNYGENLLDQSAPYDHGRKTDKDSDSSSASVDSSDDPSCHELKKLLRETVKLAEAGDPQAMFDAGCMYFHGFDNSSVEELEKNYGQAMRWFREAAETDHEVAKQALYMIARLHYYGEIPAEEQSFEMSYKLREKLYQIEPSALMALNILDMKKAGIGTRFEYEDILAFIEENMDRFDDAGLFCAASFYKEYGDFQKAIETLERIRSIVPQAQYELGMLYLRGLHRNPPKPEPRIAMHHLGLAGDGGMHKALYELGLLYFRGAYGFHKNQYKARELLKEAADKGSMEAQYVYAWVCRHGLGGNRDLAEARKYFEMGAGSGHFHCMIELAQLYQIRGYRDYEKAFTWARKAVESGNLYGEVILGNLYFAGRGCKRDPDKAMIHYKKALKYGFFDAGMMIRRIEEEMNE